MYLFVKSSLGRSKCSSVNSDIIRKQNNRTLKILFGTTGRTLDFVEELFLVQYHIIGQERPTHHQRAHTERLEFITVKTGRKDRRVGLTATEGKQWASGLSADNATQIRAFVPTEELRARGRGPCHVGE